MKVRMVDKIRHWRLRMGDIQKEAHNFWHVRVESCDVEPDYPCNHEIPRLHRSYANCIVLSINSLGFAKHVNTCLLFSTGLIKLHER